MRKKKNEHELIEARLATLQSQLAAILGTLLRINSKMEFLETKSKRIEELVLQTKIKVTS